MDADRIVPEDLTSDYTTKVQSRAQNKDAQEAEQFFINANNRSSFVPTPRPNPADNPGRPLPVAPPLRRKTDDPLGRLEPTKEQKGQSIGRNISEIPGAVAGGVESAVKNAMGWAIDPLANWLNDNVADLSYTREQPSTVTGHITKDVSEFLTGFMPFLRGVKAAGVTNQIAAPMIAGMMADFSVRDPSQARLADLWKKMNLPDNVLTDFLSSKPDDTQIESRFKNSLEGAGLGVLTEGVFMAARALRAMKNVKGAKATEDQYLRDKYGEIDDETYKKIVGDPSKPSVETVVHEPSPAVGKIQAAVEGTRELDPRSVIRSKAPAKSGPHPDVVKFDSLPDSLKEHATAASIGFREHHVAVEKIADEMKISIDEAEKLLGEAVLIRNKAYPRKLPSAEELSVLRPEQIKNFEDPLSLESIALSRGYTPKDMAKRYQLMKHQDPDWPQTDEKTWANQLDYIRKVLYDESPKFAEGRENGYYTHSSVMDEIFPLKDSKEATRSAIEFLKKDPEALIDKLFRSEDFRQPNEHVQNLLRKGPEEVDRYLSRHRGEAVRKLAAESGWIPPNSVHPIDAANAVENQVKQQLPKDWSVYINFAKFDEPDQVKFAIGKMAEANKGAIDDATRGVITQKETERLANDLNMTVTELLERRKGQPLNAEEAVAARQLWAASAEKLLELAKVAGAKNAGDLDVFAFRRQMAIHNAIQQEVIGARTETARALASWKIPVKGSMDRARAVDQVIKAMGGPGESAEMARKLAILAEEGNLELAKFVNKAASAKTADAIKELWINGLLSAPKTHMVNMFSNTLVMFSSIGERAVAGGMRSLMGGEGTQLAEAGAMAFGLTQSIREAFQMAAKALKTGETSWTFNKMDLASSHNISSEAMNIASETGLGRFVDFIGNATRVPTRLLGAEDEFFKTIGYRMEVYAQAARTAKQEGHEGYEFGKRVADLVNDPPEHIMINSADAALYNTFTNEMGNFGKAMLSVRNNVPAATFVLPFVRTPVNIARYAFERTPFAPLVSQWRADIAAGGARADLAMARMATGTAIMLTAMDFADKGIVSGAGIYGGKDASVTEALIRQGWQPYSIRVGDRWYSYNRADPFGMTMGFAASVAEAFKRGEISEDQVDEWQEIMAMCITAVSQVAINKTYLEGFARFVEVMSDAKRYSQKYVDDLFASFLPMTSASAAVKNMVDPVAREVNTPLEAIEARVAGLSEQLTPRRDLWGKEMKPNESGLGVVNDVLNPISSKAMINSPIDKEMVRLNHGMERIKKQTSFDGVQANFRFYPKAYDDYVRLAGNDLKHPGWNMGAKDYLDAVVSGQHPMSQVYNIMTDETKKAFIQNTIEQYRKLAQRQVLSDPKHVNFAAEVNKLKEIRQQQKLPIMGAN